MNSSRFWRPYHAPISWAAFGLCVLALGMILDDWFAHAPRCTIPLHGSLGVDRLFPDGSKLVLATPHCFADEMPRAPQKPDSLPTEQLFQVWNTPTGEMVEIAIKTIGSQVIRTGYSPSCRFLAVWEAMLPVAGANKSADRLHLIDLRRDRQIHRSCETMKDPIFVYSPSDTFVFVFDADHASRTQSILVETATGKIVQTFPPTIPDFVPDESLMIYATNKGSLRDLHFWQTRTRSPFRTIAGAKLWVISGDGRTAAVVISEDWVLIDLATMQKRRLRDAKDTKAVSFSPDGKTLVFVFPQNLEFWDVVTAKKRGEDPETIRDWQLRFGSFSPDSAIYAIHPADMRSELMMWDVSSARLLWSRNIERFGFSRDSRSVIDMDSCEILDSRTGGLRFGIPADDCKRKFSADNRFVTLQRETRNKLEQVRVIDLSSGREVARVETNPNSNWLSEDGATLVTSHGDNDGRRICCWDVPLARPFRFWIHCIQLGLVIVAIGLVWWRWRRRVSRESAPA
ncbi:MAG: hypothetical protein FJ271_04915 [Planctomycetes bacterium]|nr:hypothetical protein [Planctomycetota bacterium]